MKISSQGAVNNVMYYSKTIQTIKYKNMTYEKGIQIYSWTIISDEIKDKSRSSRPSYIIKCQCGTEMVTRKTRISKLIESGGCRALQVHCKKCVIAKRKEERTEELFFGKIYSHYKRSAKVRGLEFDLDRKFSTQLFKSNCSYCNSAPYNEYKFGENIVYTGLDRIDSSKGYITSNVQPCCKKCNIAKLDSSHSEFLSHIEKIYNFSVKGSSTIP